MQRNPAFPLCPLWCQHNRAPAETKQGSVHVVWPIVAEFLSLIFRGPSSDGRFFDAIHACNTPDLIL